MKIEINESVKKEVDIPVPSFWKNEGGYVNTYYAIYSETKIKVVTIIGNGNASVSCHDKLYDHEVSQLKEQISKLEYTDKETDALSMLSI